MAARLEGSSPGARQATGPTSKLLGPMLGWDFCPPFGSVGFLEVSRGGMVGCRRLDQRRLGLDQLQGSQGPSFMHLSC